MTKHFFKLIFKILKWIFLIIMLSLFLISILMLFGGRIYIELLIIFILIFSFLIWKWWYNSSKKKLLENYNPENDKGKKAEDGKNFIRASGIERAEQELATSITSDGRDAQPQGRRLLSSAKADDDGKINPSRRKTGKSPRGLFARRKRRRN